MHQLSRKVRFAVNQTEPPVPGVNGYAGNPPPAGLERWYEIEVTCRGKINPMTGYVVDIKTIDKAVRDVAPALLDRAVREQQAPEQALAAICRAIERSLPVKLDRVKLALSPYHFLAMSVSDPASVVIRERFDFSAAHRLHAPELSDAENFRLYGKCNNPRGHGHNYVVEPAVRVPLHENARSFSLLDLEEITDRVVIREFDHKHLNEDTVVFCVAKGGVLPSVENIARVCYERLKSAIEAHPSGARLERITVWETDRTSATYPG